MMTSLSLTEDQREWQERARTFAEDEIQPISIERDRIPDPADTFDWEIVEKGSKLGFRSAAVPKQFGGGGLDAVGQVLVMFELARGDSAIAKTFTQCWKWSRLLTTACTDDQRQRFLTPFLEDHRYLLAKGGTELRAGSDNRMLPDDVSAGWMTSAVREGDEWVLNGRKQYIANGGVAKLYFIDTRTDPTVKLAEGTTLFLVPADSPGFSIGKVFDKGGWRFYQNAELILEDCTIPHANLVGEVNGGQRAHGGDMSEFGDLELAANAVGVCDAALEMAVTQSKDRRQGGAQLIEHQAVQLKLSEMLMLTEALRAFCLKSAAEVDLGDARNNGVLMNFATDVIQRVTHLNMDLHGARGVMRDEGVEKLVRDAQVWTHLGGDAVQRMKAMSQLR